MRKYANSVRIGAVRGAAWDIQERAAFRFFTAISGTLFSRGIKVEHFSAELTASDRPVLHRASAALWGGGTGSAERYIGVFNEGNDLRSRFMQEPNAKSRIGSQERTHRYIWSSKGFNPGAESGCRRKHELRFRPLPHVIHFRSCSPGGFVDPQFGGRYSGELAAISAHTISETDRGRRGL